MNTPAVAIPVRLSDGDADADPRVRGANKIFDDVVELVRAAGARPVLVEPGEPAEVERVLDGCQGFVVPGGGDVDPALYGGPVGHPALYDVNHEQDRLDLAVIRFALRTGRPLLGICRGMQLLNTVHGGTLVVDLEPSGVAHSVPSAVSFAWALHEVALTPGSRCAEAYGGRRRIAVASGHHQAVGRVGEGLRVVARADDGCVEAIESADAGAWVAGVQWHPEGEGPDEALRLPLFEALRREAQSVPGQGDNRVPVGGAAC